MVYLPTSLKHIIGYCINMNQFFNSILLTALLFFGLLHDNMYPNEYEDMVENLYSDKNFNENYSTFQISAKNLYKLFIDQNRWDTAPKTSPELIFDKKEPGYMRGMINGFAWMISNHFRKLDATFLEDLHDCSIGDVVDEEGQPFSKGFRKYEDGGEAFGLKPMETVSERGIEELLSRRITYQYIDQTGDTIFPLKNALDNYSTIFQDLRIKLRPTYPETCKENANFVISIYEQTEKTTEEQKLRAIVRLCQDLNQLHLFVDGNIRTIGILLLNKLLVDNDLEPCCLADPNCLDCLSEEELIAQVKKGMLEFERLKYE